jgi:peptide/nickel transport system substrate-binding protein
MEVKHVLATRRVPTAAVVLAALLATGAHAVNGKPAIDRDTVVFAIAGDIGNLDAQVASTGDSHRYAIAINDTLYGFDAKGNLEPRVATAVKIGDDGLRYTFTLRTDVRFHNGVILTAKDVKFSLERVLKPETKSTRRPNFAPVVESVSAADDWTVVVQLKKADGAFLNKVAGYLFLVPKEYTESLPTPEAFAKAPIGCGPFRFVEQKIGQSVELARFEGYWGKKPGVKRLVYRLIPEAASRVNALVAGEVDLADSVPPADVARLKQVPGLTVTPVKIGSPLMVRLYSNVPGTPLSNQKVRVALNLGYDANAIIKNVLHGIGEPMATFVSSIYPYGNDPALKPYPYDPARAKKLLAEAGYPNGFETEIYSSNVMPKDVTEALVAYWSAIGVRAKIKFIDYAAWARLDNTHKGGPMSMTRFPNAIYDPSHPIGGGVVKAGTWSDYENAEIEKIFAETEGSADRDARDRAFRRITRILHDDAQTVPITELFIVFAKDAQLNWEQQPGSGYYNLREIAWK